MNLRAWLRWYCCRRTVSVYEQKAWPGRGRIDIGHCLMERRSYNEEHELVKRVNFWLSQILTLVTNRV